MDYAGSSPSRDLCPKPVVSNNILRFSKLLTFVILYGAGTVNIFAEILQWKQNIYTENYKEAV